MSNKFTIKLDTPLNIPKIDVTFNGGEVITLYNHTETEVDLEPGRYDIRAVYSLIFGGSSMDFDREVVGVVEEGFNYEAKICLVLKIFTFMKIYGEKKNSCC